MGSEFTFTISAVEAAPSPLLPELKHKEVKTPTGASASYSLRGVKMLVVDCNASSVRSLKAFCLREGILTITFTDAASAKAWMESQSAEETPPDVCIINYCQDAFGSCSFVARMFDWLFRFGRGHPQDLAPPCCSDLHLLSLRSPRTRLRSSERQSQSVAVWE